LLGSGEAVVEMSTDEATATGRADRERPHADASPGPAVAAGALPPGRVSAGGPVGGPVKHAWREGTLTRAQELESLSAWIRRHARTDDSAVLLEAVGLHVHAAREAALAPRRWFADEPLLERAMSNLDAAEALLLDVAPPEYLLGRLPGVLNDATRHLAETDARRREVERIARRVGIGDPAGPLADGAAPPTLECALEVVSRERLTIATASRAASSAALREQLRVRSFRNVLAVTAALLTLLAIALAVVGFVNPTAIPLCFEPEQGGQTVVVCPTRQSALLQTDEVAGPASPDVDDALRVTAQGPDILLVELVGLAAAAVAAAAAIRTIRGSSEPHGLPVALAVLKLPTGALTALLGLLLMRGQFVPGLTALDTSAQILAWALIFGYAQQLFTRLVDQQAHSVLNSVRSGGTTATATSP
jgi:hypothetical protein